MLALALGFKHAYDADHLVVVSNFPTKSKNLGNFSHDRQLGTRAHGNRGNNQSCSSLRYGIREVQVAIKIIADSLIII